MPEKTGFARVWPEKVGLVDFDRKHWFSSNLAEKTGFGRIWLKKTGALAREMGILAEETGFDQFWREKLGLADFDRKTWIWLSLPKKVGFVDFDRKNWDGDTLFLMFFFLKCPRQKKIPIKKENLRQKKKSSSKKNPYQKINIPVQKKISMPTLGYPR